MSDESTDGIRLVARSAGEATHVVRAGGRTIGGGRVSIIAGPCAVETEAQIVTVARAVAAAGATFLRGGAYKPRKSPYTFQGLREEGLRLLTRAREASGLAIVTELMDPRDADRLADVADIIQIGSRNMHNYSLLDTVGSIGKPVLLKRGMAATLEELLLAAERIVSRGNEDVILCERGVRTFETATRNTLDLSAVPYLQRYSSLPVIVDPSHGTGHAWLVPQLSRAAIAVGADGLLIEVHDAPERALSDGEQALTIARFEVLMRELDPIARAVGREMAQPTPA